MELEKQCCTVEQAKKLVRLGVKIETINIWYFDTNLCEWKITGWETQYYWESSKLTFEWYPAHNVAELGILLGKYYVVPGKFGWNVKKRLSPQIVQYRIKGMTLDFPESQARAAALIWLIDNKYINPEDLKL